jgi:hypothetical protein
MNRIKRYKDFGQVDEKMGVPSAIMPMADKVTEVLLDKLLAQVRGIEDLGNTFETEVEIAGNEIGHATFPVDKMKFYARLVPHPGVLNFDSTGAFDNESFKVKDGKASFDILVNIVVNMLTFFLQLDNPKLYKIMRDKMHSTISHELTHAYESYKRQTSKKKAPKLSDTKQFIYDMVSNLIMNKGPLPEDISNLLFLIYCSASYEVNARIPQMWSEIRNIKDPHDRLDAIKESSIWTMANKLATFDADETYERMLGNVVGDDGEAVSREESIKRLNNLFASLEEQFIVGNEQHIKDVMSNILSDIGIFPGNRENEELIKTLKAHDNEYKKVSKLSAYRFLKFWEKRFNKIGRTFKHKLSKLTTYEESPEE